MRVEEIDGAEGKEIYEILQKLFYTINDSNLNNVEKSMIYQLIQDLHKEVTVLSTGVGPMAI